MAQSTAAQMLMENLRGKTLVMGIGNPMRGDDAAGPQLVQILKENKTDNLMLIDAGSAPERHLGEIEAAAPDSILLVDVVDWGGAAGEMAYFDEESLPSRLFTTHDVSLRLIMRYLREQTGVKAGLVGIQPEQIAFGTGLSAPVEDAVRRLAGCLSAEPFKANLTGVSA